MADINDISLLELQDIIRDGVENALPEKVWVRAETAAVQAKPNGHCYLELCQSEDGRVVAKARAVIWRGVYSVVRAAFVEATGSELAVGMQILARVQASYSELYGLTLVIDELEPQYTLGAAEMEKRKTIELLEKEGLMERQKRLDFPPLPFSLAVISSRTAAGFGDFCNHLDSNPYGFKFRVEVFEALMQGEDAALSISEALSAIVEASGRLAPGDRATLGAVRGGTSQQSGEVGPSASEASEGGTAAEALKTAIVKLNAVAHKLKERRMKMGAVDFDRPEIKVIVDEKGKPIDVVQKVSKESNWLIEEFMLLANRTVAEFVATDGRMNGVAAKNAKTFVYRVHDEPNTEKLEGLRDFAKGFGYKIEDEMSGRSAARALNRLMDESKGTPEEAAFKEIALRSMAKAKYSTDNIGHYGLAFDFYTHFTSPIRRYPDTMVHRLLSAYLAGGESANKGYYEGECVHASEREVVAADAERASVKYKLAEYMQSRIGQEFSGHVSGITEWGMYVELDGTHVEGMIALREMRSDWFEFDEKRYRLVGRHSRKIYRLGDPVRIRVKGAEPQQRQIDFELAE